MVSFISKKLTLFLNSSFLFLFIFYVTISYLLHQPHTTTHRSLPVRVPVQGNDCTGLHDHTDSKFKCIFIKSNSGCRPKGYINYLQIFYCTFGKFPVLGYVMLSAWLAVLFYLLGNTAAEYFCSSLENLSNILNLSPAIAGVTLLSLGNGAPDVFASIVSFTSSKNGDFGLNSILGGAFFVSSAVVGVISIIMSPRDVSIDKCSFIRDVFFFLFSLFTLVLIISVGKITLWASICFLSVYLFYVCVVCFMHFLSTREHKLNPLDVEELGISLLGYVDDEHPVFVAKSATLCSILELPLYLPRRLTIPVVSEDKWSKTYAVASVTLAPILLAALFDSGGSKTCLITYGTAGFIGISLGSVALLTTKKCSPPKSCLCLWLGGGFLMSVTWTYIIAEELVSLLVSIGYVFGIDPSVLGLTVLAWGNSVGDLIANVAMAVNGGGDGAQVAISGCYAVPMFNTLLGLGISFVITSWSNYPYPYVIPYDPSLFESLGFLIGGLLWALVVLPRNNMRLDRVLGFGLLAIYLCFLSLRLAKALGLFKLHSWA
ncbi:cation/calcium exchanger 1 [Euphorbia lathyris]|uniref:cation/calcium exchanger 1 n=1 Tax=Euphorbia lathyris TaxID=212925 RepID=UPI0033130A10